MPEGSADIIYRMWRISLLCRSKSRSRREYLIPTDNIIEFDHFFNLTDLKYDLTLFFDNLVYSGLLFLDHPVYGADE